MNKGLLKWIFSGDNRGILGINRRNIGYIYPGSVRKFFLLADRKLETKRILAGAGLPFPETISVFSEFMDTIDLEDRLMGIENFVIKPDRGRMGSGIMVLGERSGDGYLDAGGEYTGIHIMKKRLADIILGVYSNGLSDVAILEERIFPHKFFYDLYPRGLSDIRIITWKKKPVMAMMRVPTGESGGRANLHQGGVGVAIDMESGTTYGAMFKKKEILNHPDTGSKLTGIKVPCFREMINMCKKLPDSVHLNYLGFDFAVDVERGPLILEVNARPGLEIQNIGSAGLYRLLLNLEREGL